jgi:hypothetical protein
MLGIGAAELTLCPEAMVADLVSVPNELLEAQLSEGNERDHNHKKDCKHKNREEKKNESPGRSYHQCDGPLLGGYRGIRIDS